MCLSTAYKNEVKEENVLMKNVMSFEINDDVILLTDLMERKKEIIGKLIKADLNENYIVIKTL